MVLLNLIGLIHIEDFVDVYIYVIEMHVIKLIRFYLRYGTLSSVLVYFSIQNVNKYFESSLWYFVLASVKYKYLIYLNVCHKRYDRWAKKIRNYDFFFMSNYF